MTDTETAARATVTWEGDVAVVRMHHDENRFHPDLLDVLEGALDAVEGKEGPAALVITGDGKFFSNGLDLDHMASLGDGAIAVVERVQRMLARVLGFPAPTIAALNGHVFAAGAMLAMCCDGRVMRADRGYFCLPEVDIHIPFTPGMNALLAYRLDHAVRHEAMVLGKRFGGAEAAERHIVDAAVAEAEVLPAAIERAAALAPKKSPTIGTIKARLYEKPLKLLVEPVQFGA